MFFCRKNRTNAQCALNPFQHQAISNLILMCTLEPGHSSVTCAIEDSVNKPIWKIIFFCIQVSRICYHLLWRMSKYFFLLLWHMPIKIYANQKRKKNNKIPKKECGWNAFYCTCLKYIVIMFWIKSWTQYRDSQMLYLIL